ncbi:hypothetical protein [Clostridium botulinum]|uniref:hypothetical protein n=1 Tax=Clostridium botulinum TaxID=1491 RepID=UPI000773BEA3|nr:hypothetical protein [Clostridium botulinum]
MLPKIFKNKYLSKEQQIKRSFIKGLAISILLIVIIIVFYQTLVIPKVKKSERIRVINNIEKEKEKEVRGYILTKNVNQGDRINIERDLREITLPKELMPDNCSSKEKIKDKVVKMDLQSKTVITDSVLLQKEDRLTQDLRKQDYAHFILNKNLQKGNYIDVRLKKKDGSDFVVVSKKQVLDLNGSSIVIKINDSERSYINNATVEASVTGATLYTTIYVDPQNQVPAQIDYEINKNIKSLIKNNPNVVKSAEQELQNRNGNQNSNENTTNNNQNNNSNNGKPQFIEGGSH